MLPLERTVLIVTCTARPAFSAASDAATTAVADPGDGAVAAGEQRRGGSGRGVRGGRAAGRRAGRAEPGRAVPEPCQRRLQRQQRSSASPARVASADARRDRFTFLC